MRHQVLNVPRRSRTPPALADGELLARFVSRRDEAAFAALVQRHGPLVLGVCRRLLGHAHDAEDAFQATFLVLVRKAGSIRRGESLSCWLHGVARRTALRLKAQSLRRAGEPLGHAEPVADSSVASAALREAMQIFDEELTRLPQSYRSPLVLCYLDGKTHDEAARELGWTLGTFRGRLERARDKLRDRLTRRDVSLPAALVGLGLGTAVVPMSLVRASVDVVTTASLSPAAARVAEGVCNAMFASKMKRVAAALGMAAILGVAGVAVVPGVGAPTPRAVADDHPAKPSPELEIEKLIKQLGAAKFTDREAAQARLRATGRAAMPAVRARMKDPNPEIAKRCATMLPLMQVDLMTVNNHPVWVRFKKVVGGDAASRSLYVEMVSDPRRAELLEAAEADPDKADDVYRPELTRAVEQMKRAYDRAEKAAGGRTGLIWPDGGIPTPGEYGTLLFLGTYPATAAVTFKQADDHDRVSHHNVFGLGLTGERTDDPKKGGLPAPVRKLFAAWLATRTDPNPIQFGINLGLYHGITDILPTARTAAADASLDPKARGFALLAVGQFGAAADRPLVEKAFADDRLFHATKYTSEKGQQWPVESLVRDAALAAALHLAGQHPADFGFPFLEMYKERGPDTLLKYHLLVFSTADERAAAHKKGREWLDEHK